MAKSTKGSGTLLLPIAIIGVVVVAIIAGVFAFGGEETPPDEPTVIAEDDIQGEPAGAGTLPEGEADEVEEGITELVDDVSPAPAGIDEVPATEFVDSTGPDIEGETIADEQVADTVDDSLDAADASDPEPLGTISTEATQAGGADGEQDDGWTARIREEPLDQSATEEFLIDEETIGTGDAENVDMPAAEDDSAEALPEGRDAQTDLDPSECQDIVRDTDSGGASFIPTPVGPGSDNRSECP